MNKRLLSTSCLLLLATAFILAVDAFGISGLAPSRHATRKITTTTATCSTTTEAASPSTASSNAENKKNEKDATTTTATSSSSYSWFPRTIQESVDYERAVDRLYVRHVVTETLDMAAVAYQQYTQLLLEHDGSSALHEQRVEDNSGDAFGRVAALMSACTATRNQGGVVGWVDRPTHRLHQEEQQEEHRLENGRQHQPQAPVALDKPSSRSNVATPTVIPMDIQESLFARQPKAGDLITLSSNITGQCHMLLVEELWMKNPLQHLEVVEPRELQQKRQQRRGEADLGVVRLGSHTGRNALIPRTSKFKGRGVVPSLPSQFASKTYRIQTVGCQMNVADSEHLEGILQRGLHMQPSKEGTPDLVLLNTCSIREHAESKLYNTLGPYAAQKRRGKQIAIIVTGCVAQQQGEALLRHVPEIDAVLGPQYIPYLPTVLEQITAGTTHQLVATAPMLIQEPTSKRQQREVVSSSTTTDGFLTQPIRGHDVRAWVNVIYGCNEHCTYCVVPATRGMEQSRTAGAILEECRALAEAGYREVTLLGQNIDAYGRDMTPKRTFADLLHHLNHQLRGTSIARIRYVTSHPRYFSDRVIDAVANLDKVCECFHMPFQAGDDGVLRAMRRGYSHHSYLKIIRKIRAAAPDAAITTDIIVGFPGETEQAFQKTLQLMEAVKFDNVNSFAYSPRPNTEAAVWDSQIPEDVKAERLQRVQALAAEHAHERSLRYVGRCEEILVEDSNPKRPQEQVMGRTRQGRQVFFDGKLNMLRGKLVRVNITTAGTWSLQGVISNLHDL